MSEPSFSGELLFDCLHIRISVDNLLLVTPDCLVILSAPHHFLFNLQASGQETTAGGKNEVISQQSLPVACVPTARETLASG